MKTYYRDLAIILLALAPLFVFPHRTMAGPAASEAPSFTEAQTKAIESIIRSYLVKHPDVLVEAQQALARQRAEAERAKREKIFARLPSIVDRAGIPILGNPKAETTIVQFFDYACVFCRHDWPVLKQLLAADHSIRIALIEFPIIKRESQTAALLSLSVWKHAPKAFMRYHDTLLSLEAESLPDATVKRAAKAAGLTDTQVADAESNQDFEHEISGNNDLAEQIGVNGTPAFVIYANKHPGAAKFFPQFMNASELKAAIASVQDPK